MEICEAWIVISNNGNNVHKKNITPAEAVLIKRIHGKSVGGNPVTQIKITGKALTAEEFDSADKVTKTHNRTSVEEYRRLSNKYGSKVVSEAYPGDESAVSLPDAFSDAGFEEKLGWQATSEVAPTKYDKNNLKDDDLVFTTGPAGE